MKKLLFSCLMLLLLLSSCTETVNDIVDSTITANQKKDEVLQTAKQDFSADAEIAAIYGRNVSQSGEIDLKSTDNAFVYVVQSDIMQSNEFYVPLFGAGPVKSPINFDAMLQLVKDTTAANILGTVFGTLATASIDPAANYDDSPLAVQTALVNGGSAFITQNTNTKIDMLLVPSKSIDSTSVINSADWIINFYSDSNSLVLWINSESGIVTTLSGN
jgi:hypothetical protein